MSELDPDLRPRRFLARGYISPFAGTLYCASCGDSPPKPMTGPWRCGCGSSWIEADPPAPERPARVPDATVDEIGRRSM